MHRIIIISLTFFITCLTYASDPGRQELRPSKKIRSSDRVEVSEFECLPFECLVMIFGYVEEPLSLLLLNRNMHDIAKYEAEKGRMRWVRQFNILDGEDLAFQLFLDALKANRDLTKIKINKKTRLDLDTSHVVVLLEVISDHLTKLFYLDIDFGHDGYEQTYTLDLSQLGLPKLDCLTELHISGDLFFDIDCIHKKKIKRVSVDLQSEKGRELVYDFRKLKNLSDLNLINMDNKFIDLLRDRPLFFEDLKKLKIKNVPRRVYRDKPPTLSRIADPEELIIEVDHVCHIPSLEIEVKHLTIIVNDNRKRGGWLDLLDKIGGLPLKSLKIIPPVDNPRVVFKLDSRKAKKQLAIFSKLLEQGVLSNTDVFFAESKDVNKAIEFDLSLGEQKALDEFLRMANELVEQKKSISPSNAKKILNAFKAANFDFFFSGDVATLASSYALLNQPTLQGDEALIALRNTLLWYVTGFYSNHHFEDVIDIYKRSGTIVQNLDHRLMIFTSHLEVLRPCPLKSSWALILVSRINSVISEIMEEHEDELSPTLREMIREFQRRHGPSF